MKCFQPDFCHIFRTFPFINSENTTKFKETSEFKQETLNILSALKFAGSHLALYEWKVSFSLISPRIFSLGFTCQWLLHLCALWSTPSTSLVNFDLATSKTENSCEFSYQEKVFGLEEASYSWGRHRHCSVHPLKKHNLPHWNKNLKIQVKK